MGWDDLWLTPNQRAKRLLDTGQAQQAAELFDDPAWQAAARYQSGEFDKAAEQFEASDAAYNRANALAKAGKLEAALKSYDEALAAHPGDDDARFNRDLVQKLLDQQQQEQQGQNDQQGQKDQQEDSGQSAQDGKPSDEQGDRSEQSRAQAEQESAGSESKEDPSQSPSPSPSEPQPETGDHKRAGSQDEKAAADNEQRDAEQQKNEQQQVKDDVAPQSATASKPDGQARNNDATRESEVEVPSEKELALQQWLRQVPDDPGGLLRRKFMLEHLQRQKEQQNR